MDVLIHKVRITAEAVFDYEDDFGGNMHDSTPFGTTVKTDIKQQVEEYMLHSRKHWHKPYFKVPYMDEITGERLLLFFRTKERFECMQIIDLVGIAREQDWDEDLDEMGAIKAWLDSKIDLTDVPFADWVERERQRQAEHERDQKLDEEEQRRHERRFG